MKATIDGIAYETSSEVKAASCIGCIADTNDYGVLCNELSNLEPCLYKRVIWIKEPKENTKDTQQVHSCAYTEDQVRSVIDVIREIDGIDISGKFWDYLKVASDVEYNEYIRLKNKFNPK